MGLYGDWAKAGAVLKKLGANLNPVAKGKLYENGELVLETIQGHIDNQDLDWTPLAPSTVKMKTPFLSSNLGESIEKLVNKESAY